MKMKILKEYSIKASTVEDALENWIWTNDETFDRYIKILNPKTNKSIVVFKRTIDPNFITFYNSKNTTREIDPKKLVIVINEYYRKQLGINKNEDYKLIISEAHFFEKVFNSNWEHPNPSVSLSYKINIISFTLGIVSILLGIVSLIITFYSL